MGDKKVDARQERGLVIAATAKVVQKGSVWLVPSQSGNGRYTVSPDEQHPHCTCPDHEERGCECKHIYAVRFVIQRELFDDGTEVETRQLTITEKRKTYAQDWSAYNAAQCSEKDSFQSLLHDLCQEIPETIETKAGRPRMPVRDGIFCACFKTYSMLSGRRFTSDLCDAHAKGYISRVPHFNPVLRVFDKEETITILRELIAQSAAPLAAVESNFAIDSTGFSGCRFDRWFETKWGNAPERKGRVWVKAHAMIGCTTNVVTAVEVTNNNAHDGAFLEPLMCETAKRFKIEDLTADKAYLSELNLHLVADIGATALIPFKTNSKPNRAGVWNTAYHYFNLHREEFLRRYHRRSNVESTFSAIKRKYGDSVRAKNDRSMVNETLAKFLCHNIACLIHATEEFGIDPTFGCTKNNLSAPKLNVI
jgi:transposase